MTREIVVLAYPRSGSTWLTRLLGASLNSPIRDLPGEKSYAAEERPDNGFVLHQTHVLEKIPQNASVIHLVRDPRDVAVSMFHYWQLNDLEDALACVLSDNVPPVYLPAWHKFNREAAQRRFLMARYVDLQHNPAGIVQDILNSLKIKVKESDIQKAVKCLSMSYILDNIAPVNYPLPMHVHSIRKGQAEDWRNYLTGEQSQRVWNAFREMMQLYGYEL